MGRHCVATHTACLQEPDHLTLQDGDTLFYSKLVLDISIWTECLNSLRDTRGLGALEILTKKKKGKKEKLYLCLKNA